MYNIIHKYKQFVKGVKHLLLTVIQNGKKIINGMWNGCKADDTVHTMSVTKSIVSLLVGIAIEQGLIGSIAALDFLGGRRGMTGEFQYSASGIHIFTGIIAAVSKVTTVDFANKYLFEPLMIAPRKLYIAPDAEAHKAFTVGKTPKGNRSEEERKWSMLR